MSRPRGALLEDVLELAHPLLDPLDRRRPEDLVATAPKGLDLVGESVDAPFGLDERLRQRLAAASLADEVDEVGEPALLGGQLSLLQLERVGQVGAEPGDFLFDAPEDVSDVLRIGDLLLDRLEDELLNEGASDERLVLARSLRGREAAVVPARLAAHLSDGGATAAARHAAGEQMRREVLLPTALLL